MSEKRQIARRAGIVGFFTFVSRLTGLARDMAIAYAFGTRAAADAFFVAFRIPNLLRRLFAEGALTVSFVPIFSKTLKTSEAEAKRVASVSFTLLLCLLAGIAVLGIVASPALVKLTAWGFSKDVEKYRLTVFLTRVMFPYILLVSLAAWAMGVLNSLKRFGVPAAASIFMNLGIIAGAIVLTRVMNPPILGLAIGVLIGGFFQLAVHFPVLARVGFFPKLQWDPKHPAVRRIVGLMIPSAYGAAVYQFNVMAMTLFASFLPNGSISYLWYADRVTEFPLGVFAVSIATVILPSLADHGEAEDKKHFRETFLFGLRLIFFVTLPAAAGLMMLAPSVIRLLFEHGSFGPASTQATAAALRFFVMGMPFVAGVRITANAFYSLHDSKTTVKSANMAVIINLVCALILMRPLGHVGLALALSLASIGNFTMHILHLRKKIGSLNLRSLLPSVAKSVLASAVMAAGLWALLHRLPWADATKAREGLRLMILIASGAGIYAAMGYLLRMEELKKLKTLLKRKTKNKTPPQPPLPEPPLDSSSEV